MMVQGNQEDRSETIEKILRYWVAKHEGDLYLFGNDLSA